MKIDQGYSLPTPELNWPSEKKDNNLLNQEWKKRLSPILQKLKEL